MTATNPSIVAITGGEEWRFTLEPMAVCRLGRSEDSTIMVIDTLASREHAMVRRDASGQCYLSDLGSRNGTTINRRPVNAPVLLKDGDIIGIGTHELRFEKSAREVTAKFKPPSAVTQFFLANSLITVLVIDIRGYTRLSRKLGEKRISEMMSEIFQFAGDLLNQRGSWSQKYIGDAVMGVWVHAKPEVTVSELAGIIDMIGELVVMFSQLPARIGLDEPVAFGCALNTGYASIGNMGSASMSDFTALGDTVNKAFRLESATKEVGFDLLIGKDTMGYLTPPPPPETCPPIILVDIKGYDAPEPAYRLTFGDLPRFVNVIEAALPVEPGAQPGLRPFPRRLSGPPQG